MKRIALSISLIFFLLIIGTSVQGQNYSKPFLFKQWVKNQYNKDTATLFHIAKKGSPAYCEKADTNSLKRFYSHQKVPLAFFMNDTSGTVKQYEKLEIGIDLPNDLKEQINVFLKYNGRGINPFNPEQISIEAEFIKIKNKIQDFKSDFVSYENAPLFHKIYGFYYEPFHHEKNERLKHGFWKKDTSSFNFRIRFTPRITGQWQCIIRIYAYGELKMILEPFNFICTKNDKKGVINSISSNHRFFQFENGDTFFGIGQNIPIADLPNAILPDDLSKYREQPPKGFAMQRNYIQDLSNNGGNLVRIMHGEWADAIEWEKLNDYSMNMQFAAEFDSTIYLCNDLGVYIIWLQQMHTAFMYHNPYGNDNLAWPNNPYHLYLGLENPEEFFSNNDAIKLYKYKIRYMLSRWGFSPMIAGIQPMSEINEMATDLTTTPNHHPYFTDTSFRNTVGKWFHEIKKYIQIELGYDFLIGSSYTADVGANVVNDPVMKIADFNDYHPYGQNRNRNIGGRFGGINITPGYGIFKRYSKPVLIGEMGAWETEFLQECNENEFHNDIWGTAFIGAAGAGLHWHNWEDNYHQNLRENFNGINKFMSRVNFTNKNYQPKRWPEKEINSKNYSVKRNDYFENLFLVNKKNKKDSPLAIGWVHNRSAYWYNYPETDCEKNLSNKKSNDSKGKESFKPDDDDENSFEKYEGDSNKKKRITRVKGLSKFRKYKIYWVSTETGEKIIESKKFFWLGKFKLKIPNEINSSTYQDLAYYIYYNNHKFEQP